jgi:hypothetical protein
MAEFEQLKQAIEDNNMSAVCRAYEDLTGEAVKPKRKSRGRKESGLREPSTLPPEPPNSEIQALKDQIAMLTETVQATVASAPAQPARQRPRLGGGPNRFNPEQYEGAREPGEEFINDQVTPTPRGSIPRQQIQVTPNEDIPLAPGMKQR